MSEAQNDPSYGRSVVPVESGLDTSTDGDPVVTIRALINAVEHFTGAIGTRFGLSSSENVALRELAVHGSLTPGDIAERTGLTSSSVTNLIDRLERTGHARRRAHPDDRRSVLIDLTESGNDALTWARSLMVLGLDGIDVDEMPAAMALLRQVAASLDRQADLINRGDV